MTPNWTRLVRFIAEEDGQVHLGEVDAEQIPDVGLAIFKGEKVTAKLVQGSIFDGVVTDKHLQVARVWTYPLMAWLEEVLTIREAPFSNWDRRCPNHPMHGAQLSRPCAGGEHAHSRHSSSFHKASDSLKRALPSED